MPTTPSSGASCKARRAAGSAAADYGSTVNVNLAVLCDAANVSREGKLNVLGEFDSIHASTFPLTYPTMVLVVRLEAHPTEAGDHTLRLHLNDEDGQDVVPPLQGEFPTGDPPFLGVPIRTAPLILQMHGVRFEHPGHYSFELLVDGHHLRSLALHVVAGEDDVPVDPE
jgi:hypothetical protein